MRICSLYSMGRQFAKSFLCSRFPEAYWVLREDFLPRSAFGVLGEKGYYVRFSGDGVGTLFECLFYWMIPPVRHEGAVICV
ncbi:hypothetical protein ASPCAL09921 [Aspergillus calidoustus]|uniref:Uncharacterized protein n=1 Tax=Aspergillus calidoustus TaxID=454130 RepID=A0A0U5G756_ASPCI|nr:hypothetical protein ASPCAL09921 [Aspergillus calidoustus]